MALNNQSFWAPLAKSPNSEERGYLGRLRAKTSQSKVNSLRRQSCVWQSRVRGLFVVELRGGGSISEGPWKGVLLYFVNLRNVKYIGKSAYNYVCIGESRALGTHLLMAPRWAQTSESISLWLRHFVATRWHNWPATLMLLPECF